MKGIWLQEGFVPHTCQDMVSSCASVSLECGGTDWKKTAETL